MKKFNDLNHKPDTPESLARGAELERGLADAIALGELRSRRGAGQSDIALAIGSSQPNVSRIERQPDLYVSTLEEYVAALGGRLRILAEFDDETVELAPSRRAAEAAADRAKARV
jgi:hypothetical protein